MFRDILKPPNLLTLTRIAAAPLVPIYFDNLPVLLSVAVLASLTDMADGFVARHWGMITRLGIYLDPLADKVFVLCFLIGAMVHGRLTWWQCALLISRDLYVGIPGLVYLVISRNIPKRLELRSRVFGKACTVAQFLTMGAVVIIPQHPVYLEWALGLVAVTSLAAIVDYTWHFVAVVWPRYKDLGGGAEAAGDETEKA